jgi:hypothetical protein
MGGAWQASDERKVQKVAEASHLTGKKKRI